MVCDDADQNCPYVTGMKRFSLTYKDPKYADESSEAETAYQACFEQIGVELSYAFHRAQLAIAGRDK